MNDKTLRVRFYGPTDWFGHLLCWVGRSPYCHVNVEIGPGAVLEVPLFGKAKFYPAKLLDAKRPPLVSHEVAPKVTSKQVQFIESFLTYPNQPWRTVYHWFRHRRLDLSHNCHSMCWDIVFQVTGYLYSPRNLIEMEAYLAQESRIPTHLPASDRGPS